MKHSILSYKGNPGSKHRVLQRFSVRSHLPTAVPTLNRAYAVSAFPLWEFFRMFTTLSGNPISSRKGTTFTPLRKKQKVIYIYI